jgi:apolipoprotein D and lipocalin family protein
MSFAPAGFGTRGIARLLLLVVGALAGCAGNVRPIQPVAHVDISRFMGSWYVIASIPSLLEKNAYNAVESYALLPDGRIRTTFHYRNNGFDTRLKTMHPIGTVRPGSGNAVWGMQFLWPIQAEYIVAYLDDQYSETIIARNKRDYVWIMARTPSIPKADYVALVERVRQLGYSTKDLRNVPQQWPEMNR